MDSTTTFGIELEVILPQGVDYYRAAADVAAASGIPIHAESYNHATPRGHWKVVSDGSLIGNGAEFVSPPLKGLEGLAEIRKVCGGLNSIGARINRSCGLHVHLGITNESPATIKNLLRIYAHYEAEIDLLMPGSRRGNGNNYCKSIAHRGAAIANANGTMWDLRHSLNGADRYMKVNMLAYDRYRTIEFRQHSGTTDPDKVENWIKLLLAMLGAARKGKFPQGERPAIIAKPGSKAAGVGALILRDGGATSDEINAFVGREGVNVITIARACGIQIAKRREGRSTRYTAISGGAAAAASFESLTAMIELPPDITSYYAKRKADLAGMSSADQEREIIQNAATATPRDGQ